MMAAVNSYRKIYSSISRLLLNKDRYSKHLSIQRILFSTTNDVTKEPEFDCTIGQRKNEASRSLVIELSSSGDARFLLKNFGNSIKSSHLYKLCNGKECMLLEFKSTSDLESFTNLVTFTNSESSVPVYSRFVAFRNARQNNDDKCSSTPVNLTQSSPQDYRQLKSKLLAGNDISHQMSILYDECKLTDLEIRLRFLICTQIEFSLISLFPRGCVYPFGSAVNGFGRRNCDLDMAFQLASTSQSSQEGSFIYRNKPCLANVRSQSQRDLEVIGDMLDVFFPGCTNVQRILQARVPIIKFYHHYTEVDCDFTTSNMSGVYMSKLLHQSAIWDPCVRPLVFTVLKWAKSVNLTQTAPGPCLTNFQLTLLVIFYLQQKNKSFIPPFSTIFTTKKTKNNKSEKKDNFSDILLGFYSFYESFDYKQQGISVLNGTTTSKRDNSCLYIENPIERDLNVARNVNLNNLKKFVDTIRIALWCLDCPSSKDNNLPWGIINLFESQQSQNVGFRVHSLFPSTSQQNSSVDLLLDNFTNKTLNRPKQRRKIRNIKLTRNW